MLNYGPAVLIIFSVFVGILLNRRDLSALRAELRGELGSFRDEVRREFDQVRREQVETNRRLTLIETDQKHFFQVTGKLDGRIDEPSRR